VLGKILSFELQQPPLPTFEPHGLLDSLTPSSDGATFCSPIVDSDEQINNFCNKRTREKEKGKKESKLNYFFKRRRFASIAFFAAKHLKNVTVATITFFATTPTERKKTRVASLQLLPSSFQAKRKKNGQ